MEKIANNAKTSTCIIVALLCFLFSTLILLHKPPDYLVEYNRPAKRAGVFLLVIGIIYSLIPVFVVLWNRRKRKDIVFKLESGQPNAKNMNYHILSVNDSNTKKMIWIILPLIAIALVFLRFYRQQITPDFSTHIHPDIEHRLRQEGRPANWLASQMQLGNTDYFANAGPLIYKDESNTDPDYYAIDVQFKTEKGISLVCFARDIEIDKLPSGFLVKRTEDIVSYDENSGTVTFIIGNNNYKYVLPKP